jgi:hypothetical protein
MIYSGYIQTICLCMALIHLGDGFFFATQWEQSIQLEHLRRLARILGAAARKGHLGDRISSQILTVLKMNKEERRRSTAEDLEKKAHKSK